MQGCVLIYVVPGLMSGEETVPQEQGSEILCNFLVFLNEVPSPLTGRSIKNVFQNPCAWESSKHCLLLFMVSMMWRCWKLVSLDSFIITAR